MGSDEQQGQQGGEDQQRGARLCPARRTEVVRWVVKSVRHVRPTAQGAEKRHIDDTARKPEYVDEAVRRPAYQDGSVKQ